MEYGIAVTNKFESFFLDECDDPVEILRRQEEEAAKLKVDKNNVKNTSNKTAAKTNTTKNGTKAAAKPTKLAASTVTESKPNKIANQEPRKENAERPPRFSGKPLGTTNRPPRLSNGVDTEGKGGFGGGFGGDRGFESREFDQQENSRGRGGFRRGGRGQMRGGGGEGGFDRFGKREYDRHSGSNQGGVKAVDKREGGGAHNWGNAKDDIEDHMKTLNVSGDQTDKSDIEHTTEGKTGDDTIVNGGLEEEVEQHAEEERQLTLDEWKALEEQRKLKNSFNLRQAGEGVKADPKWKKMYQLKKKQDEDDDEEDDDDDEEEEDVHGRQKVNVDIKITFNDSGRGGGRGGRGGARGGRGGPRGGGDRAPRAEIIPNVSDEMDFPSLS